MFRAKRDTWADTAYLELKDILNPSIFTGDDRPHCLENTRKETLQSIYDWVEAEGCPNVLLLIGAAGTGKSTIATTVAGEYQKRGYLGCYMFFVREKSDPGNVLQTVAYLLAEYSQPIAESISGQLKKSRNLGPLNQKVKFDILLRQPLSIAAIRIGSPILIVLDALDECGTQEARQGLIRVLRGGLPTLPPNFRVLITSRPEKDILAFTSLPPSKIQKLDLDHQTNENRLDVYAYIRYELEELRLFDTLCIPQGWPWEESIQCLADIANGSFNRASTAIKRISEEQSDKFLSLLDVASDGKTFLFNELYRTFLETALEWNEEVRETFVRTFSVMLFSNSALSHEAINGVLGVDTAPDVLMCLKSLVVYEPGGPIVIRHTSFRDYLVSCKGNPWYIDPEVQKVYIASRCLERMGDFLRYNICDIPSIYVLNSDVPDLENRVTQCIPPFLKYICCNWAQHLRDVPYSQDLCSQLRSFAHNQLLFWFEILSLTDTFDDHVGPALLLSIDWIGVSTFININVL